MSCFLGYKFRCHCNAIVFIQHFVRLHIKINSIVNYILFKLLLLWCVFHPFNTYSSLVWTVLFWTSPCTWLVHLIAQWDENRMQIDEGLQQTRPSASASSIHLIYIGQMVHWKVLKYDLVVSYQCKFKSVNHWIWDMYQFNYQQSYQSMPELEYMLWWRLQTKELKNKIDWPVSLQPTTPFFCHLAR